MKENYAFTFLDCKPLNNNIPSVFVALEYLWNIKTVNCFDYFRSSIPREFWGLEFRFILKHSFQHCPSRNFFRKISTSGKSNDQNVRKMDKPVFCSYSKRFLSQKNSTLFSELWSTKSVIRDTKRFRCSIFKKKKNDRHFIREEERK